jgi:hypothetical protein
LSTFQFGEVVALPAQRRCVPAGSSESVYFEAQRAVDNEDFLEWVPVLDLQPGAPQPNRFGPKPFEKIQTTR